MANQIDSVYSNYTKNMEGLLFETVLLQCIDFIKTFDLPAEKDVLIELLTLTYNSFELPYYLTKNGIKKSLDLAQRDKYLVFEDKEIKFIPLSVDHLLVCSMLKSKAEFQNGNFFQIMEDLVIDDYPILELKLLLTVYNKASERYYDYKSVFETCEKPKLSDYGKKLLIKKTLDDINNDFELWYELLDTKLLDVINRYFSVLEQFQILTKIIKSMEDI